EEVWLDVDGEQTYCWWLPTEKPLGTVLFSHGSGRNISGYLEDAALFHQAGLSVMLYDYGGYGLSTGTPSQARCYADIRAAWKYLVHERKIAPDTIILAGSSMGSGATCELAAQIAPAAVILESAFTSIPDVLGDTYPFLPAQWLCQTQFRNIDKVNRFQCPVLIIHSRKDTVVPFAHSQQLYHRITTAKMFVEIQGAHHGGKFKSHKNYLQGLKIFLDKYVSLKDNDS
ncbi:MAG: alpha/beta hydrolase, partial [Candidatus Hydrogenedentes bacterium]|nr:alpha/beta hydrolase [Candidatus Hydrogenedentota bacterium]